MRYALVRLSISLATLLALTDIRGMAQEPDTVTSLPGVTVETSVSQAEIYVGDRITYSVSITYDSTIELVPPPLGANLGAFEVKDYQPDIETTLDDGRKRSETVFTISTFTTGDYVVPPLPVIFLLPDSTSRLIMTEGIPVKVKSLLGDNADTLDIKPLKSQYEFESEIPVWYYWGCAALLLIVLPLIVWLLLRRRRAAIAPVDTRTPWEIAFEELALLQQQNLVGAGAHKQYYFVLTDIARAFLGRMYRLDVLEMTTSEFDAAFCQIALPGEWFDRLMSFFQHADLVKFARATPEPGRGDQDLNLVHDLVADIRDEHLRKVEAEARLTNGKNRRAEKEKAA
ncbi:MAG: hypothetical protein RBT76_12855 [candidate division Zixibacteria bacterium]|nr:hypothetical protein [candidate division Zixibacteria bacterium]